MVIGYTLLCPLPPPPYTQILAPPLEVLDAGTDVESCAT